MHANVRIGDSILMLNDDFPEVAAGCRVDHPLQDQFWGDRYGQLRDPAGFVWSIAMRVEDLTLEEMQQRAAQALGGGHA